MKNKSFTKSLYRGIIFIGCHHWILSTVYLKVNKNNWNDLVVVETYVYILVQTNVVLVPL